MSAAGSEPAAQPGMKGLLSSYATCSPFAPFQRQPTTHQLTHHVFIKLQPLLTSSFFQGRYMTPLPSRSPSINAVGVSPLHGLVACGGEDGALECFDLRARASAGERGPRETRFLLSALVGSLAVAGSGSGCIQMSTSILCETASTLFQNFSDLFFRCLLRWSGRCLCCGRPRRRVDIGALRRRRDANRRGHIQRSGSHFRPAIPKAAGGEGPHVRQQHRGHQVSHGRRRPAAGHFGRQPYRQGRQLFPFSR